MSNAHHRVDASKYFNIKQKAFLINVSEKRDVDRFESLSGVIVGRTADSIALQISYPTDYANPGHQGVKPSFKLTTEAMGSGIQVVADLVKIDPGNIFHLKFRSNLEMYQRRQVPRIDTTVKLFQLQRAHSLDAFSREFTKISDYLRNQNVPSNLELHDTEINLGIGGLRIGGDAKSPPHMLSLFFIGLDDTKIPVCALGDLVWERLDRNVRMCGYRFILISKSDQSRITRHIQSLRKKMNITTPLPKANWELMDRMVNENATKRH